ncbi:ShlB/FhaC/HecB family hemolysin secretion/activation protein [Rheinheimera sp.]|uniref:ShlB/FhaC/HecB family hemolysin secretion/activation protein n=1 Tax=Rheinheimera sp. TaxID=1869214 RepID=UPI003AF97994
MRIGIVSCLCLPFAAMAAQQEVDLTEMCRLVRQKPNPQIQHQQVPASEDEQPTIRIKRLQINSHPIFDETAEDSFWIHEFANWMHIETKVSAIRRELPFKEGDTIKASDLAEAERLLRDKSYINDAKVQRVGDCDQDVEVQVDSWDNWSLLPAVGFGRSSGHNKYSFGFKEDNLLGYGVRTSLKYQSDYLRSGYELKVEAPLQLLSDASPDHSYLLLELTDNDDGNTYHIALDKPFYLDDSLWMAHTEWLDDSKLEQVYHNGELERSFFSQHQLAELSGGYLWRFVDNTSWRVLAGVTREDWQFDMPQGLDPQAAPADRRRNFIWTGLEYKEFAYQVLQDLYFIGRPEDINLGWRAQLKLGVLTGDSGSRLLAELSKGWAWHQHVTLAQSKLDWIAGVSDGDFHQWSFQVEDYWRLGQNWTWMNKADLMSRNRNYAEQPLELGGETGLRGYPVQFQHGVNSAVVSSELRWYPRWSWRQMLDFGFVGFVDYGRAWGGRVASGPLDGNADLQSANISDQWLGSIGAGLRIFSSKSSNHHVVHLDLSTPISSVPGVDPWEVQLMVSDRF